MQTDPRDSRHEIRLHNEHISNIGSVDFPGHFYDNKVDSDGEEEDDAWDLTKFERRSVVDIKRLSSEEIEFDFIHVDASIANAIRRCLMAEVPTVAIEKVYMYLNTSLVQDEVLAQRLGLVPIAVDPAQVDWKEANESPDDSNTLVFKLDVKCTRKSNVPKNEKDPNKLYNHGDVFSRDLIFHPAGKQAEFYAREGSKWPAAVVPDILLAKLRPGQEISCEMHCEKGVARDHAKWSPVATASYRLMPTIHITGDIPSSDADDLAACFTPGVIEVTHDPDDPMEKSVRVANPRIDTVSREVHRHAKFKDKVFLGRRRDHFIFNVETAGQFAPEQLLPEAINVLRRKIANLQEAVDRLKM